MLDSSLTNDVMYAKCELGAMSIVKQLQKSTFCMCAERSMPDLKHLYEELSSILPKLSNRSLLEIDDIIYGEDGIVGTEGISISKLPTLRYVIDHFFREAEKAFFDMRVDKPCRPVDILFLQLLDLVSKNVSHVVRPQRLIETLKRVSLKIESIRNIERLIKVLTIVLDSIEERKLLINIDLSYLSSMIYLLYISSSKSNSVASVNDRRRSHWISEQCGIILVLLANVKVANFWFCETFKGKRNPKDGRLQVHWRYDCSFIQMLITCMKMTREDELNFCIEHLYTYFMSARTSDAKRQRIHDFDSGFIWYYFKDLGKMWNLGLNQQTTSLESFTLYSKYIMEYFLRLLKEIEKCPSKEMAKLESQYGHYVCSYLPEDNCPSYVTFKDEIVKLVEKYFDNSNISKVDETSETNDVDDRTSLFDEFMKGMQLLDILHTSWKNHDPAHMTDVFRPFDSPIKKKVTRLLESSEVRDQVHWSYQVLLRNCPFLFMTSDLKSQAENLIKLLKGIVIDSFDKEVLYFAVNSKCDSPYYGLEFTD